MHQWSIHGFSTLCSCLKDLLMFSTNCPNVFERSILAEHIVGVFLNIEYQYIPSFSLVTGWRNEYPRADELYK